MSWVTYSAKEVEKLVIKEAKEGLSASQIGLKLRDTYGIPNVQRITGKRLAEIITEQNLNKKFPEDLMSLFQKAVTCNNHIKDNNQDKTAKRGLTLTRAKINRLVTYYKAKGVIDQAFRFDLEEAKLLVE